MFWSSIVGAVCRIVYMAPELPEPRGPGGPVAGGSSGVRFQGAAPAGASAWQCRCSLPASLRDNGVPVLSATGAARPGNAVGSSCPDRQQLGGAAVIQSGDAAAPGCRWRVGVSARLAGGGSSTSVGGSRCHGARGESLPCSVGQPRGPRRRGATTMAGPWARD